MTSRAAAARVGDQRGRVLVVDDERDLAESCAFFLRRAGYEVELAFSGGDAIARMADAEARRFGLVITDLKMPRISGIELLAEIKQRDPDVEVVLITGFPEVETAVAAMRHGALDYVTKPFKEEALLRAAERAFAHRGVRATNEELQQRLQRGDEGTRLTFLSERFGSMVETLERAARSDASVLLLGESGTGKELLAHHLHASSERAARPFVPVDCATMPENLIESELFGHVKGAFSGADASKMGLFQVADGGTLFLDEIGEVPLLFQPKLLRAIQERQIRRVGGNEFTSVDVRIVAATNRDLQREVDEGRFRADLFYRLDVVRIEVPPLRDRVEDIDPLAREFLTEFAARTPDCPVRGLTPEGLAALQAYDWPGNVRQLRNTIERACALGRNELAGLEDLPREIAAGSSESDRRGGLNAAGEPFQEMKARKIAAIESAYLKQLLGRHGGNVTRSADEAGMSRSALQKIMQRYGIRSIDYRDD